MIVSSHAEKQRDPLCILSQCHPMGTACKTEVQYQNPDADIVTVKIENLSITTGTLCQPLTSAPPPLLPPPPS